MQSVQSFSDIHTYRDRFSQPEPCRRCGGPSNVHIAPFSQTAEAVLDSRPNQENRELTDVHVFILVVFKPDDDDDCPKERLEKLLVTDDLTKRRVFNQAPFLWTFRRNQLIRRIKLFDCILSLLRPGTDGRMDRDGKIHQGAGLQVAG